VNTKHCIVHPQNPAIRWTAHVHDGNKIIHAGWCREDEWDYYSNGKYALPDCKMKNGCYGKYEKKKDMMAVELGRRGGLKGGNLRAKALSPERRKEIARLAAQARWKK